MKALTTLALASALLAATSVAHSQVAPSRGTISEEALARVRAEVPPSGPIAPGWEDNASREADAEKLMRAEQASALAGISDNNDTVHYARGMTLIVHVFVDHFGGNWSATEMDDAAAKADNAKTYYMNNATWASNLRFDPSGAYVFYNPFLNYTIGDTGMTEAVMEDAVAALGFGDVDGDGSRVDEITHYLQGWGGGWDNVILVFEPDVTGRAWASYGQGKTVLYTNSGWWVWAHEWGHLFGACDEYAEGGMCNGGINCGLCQSWYLNTNIGNNNCELAICGTTEDCLMKYNSTNALCDDTPQHWAWTDSNADGLGDTVRRPTQIVSGQQQYANIYELFHNGWFVWNDVNHSEVISQRHPGWSVIGLRSPADADYDMQVFTDNTHNVPLASSAWGTGQVDFVVGDYGHNNLGNEHIQLIRYSGAATSYNLTFESGGEVLYADGIVRAGWWAWNNTAVVWDVPLLAGETLQFHLDAPVNLDLGMALYKSNSSTFFANRGSGQVVYADANSLGNDETFTYTVPADDVYGLVVWSNNSADGAFTIQIGTAPFAMTEEFVHWSINSPTLFSFTPNAVPYWAVMGTRSDAGLDVDLKLYDDPNYQYLHDRSNQYGAWEPEFVAGDYNHAAWSTEYPRVLQSGANFQFNQWEGDADILYGAEYPPYWSSSAIVKVWDVWMAAGELYFFRQFSEGNTLDGGIYLYDSSNGDNFKRRSEYANGSDFRPAAQGGEWFWHSATNADWYGFVATSRGGTQGNYSMWFGPWLYPLDETPVTRADQVVWASGPGTGARWHVAGVRPAPGETSTIWLYEDVSFAAVGYRAYDSGSGARFCVADYHDIPVVPFYTLSQRASGSQAQDHSWEGGDEEIVWDPPTSLHLTDLPWAAADVAKVFDLYMEAGAPVRITVAPDAAGMNLGVALFASNGGGGYAPSTGAVAYVDVAGIGESEVLEFTAPDTDWYGLVVFNQEDAAGTYSILLQDPAATDVADGAGPLVSGLGLVSANPFHSEARLELSLAQAGAVDLAVYDVAGRVVRSLVRAPLPAGSRVVTWDGSDVSGRAAAPGVYFAHLRAGRLERRIKLVKTE